MIKTLTEEEIWNLVDASDHAHLGCHAGGKTYVLPISFAREGNRLYGVTSAGLKIEMMRQNPEVCVQMEEIRDLANWKSAILWGAYEELEGADRARASGLLVDKYGPTFMDPSIGAPRGRDVTPPRLDAQPVPLIAYAINVREVTGRAEE